MTRLAERRELLLTQVAAQRTTLAENVALWRAPLALADQGLVALRYIKSHPSLMIGTVALIAVLRPKRVGKWLRRGWVTWQIVRKLRRS